MISSSLKAFKRQIEGLSIVKALSIYEMSLWHLVIKHRSVPRLSLKVENYSKLSSLDLAKVPFSVLCGVRPAPQIIILVEPPAAAEECGEQYRTHFRLDLPTFRPVSLRELRAKRWPVLPLPHPAAHHKPMVMGERGKLMTTPMAEPIPVDLGDLVIPVQRGTDTLVSHATNVRDAR